MHYGVPGMKWGHRRAQKYASKAAVSKAAAKELELKAKNAYSKGRLISASKYEVKADIEKAKASRFEQKSKGTYSKRAEKYSQLSRGAKESANEWKELSKDARSKGKLKKAERFEQYAKEDRDVAKHYEQKSKDIVKRKLARKQFIKDVGENTRNAGKKYADKVKNKLGKRK